MILRVLCIVAVTLVVPGFGQRYTTTTTTSRTTSTPAFTTTTPGHCCIADAFELKAAVAGSASEGHGHGHEREFGAFLPRVSVDFSRKKVAVKEFVPHGHRLYNISTIADFNQQTAYISADGWKRCKRVKIPGKMGGQCVPDSAHLLGQLQLGAQGALTCQMWGAVRRDPRRRAAVFVSGLVQKASCVPVTEDVMAESWTGRVTERVMYFDYTTGIKNPSVFDVPKSCEKGAELADHDDLTETANAMLRRYLD